MNEKLWMKVKDQCEDEEELRDFIKSCCARLDISTSDESPERPVINGCGCYIQGMEHNLVLARICEHPGLSSGSYLDTNDISGYAWVDDGELNFVSRYRDVPSGYEVKRVWKKGKSYNNLFPDTKLPALTVASGNIIQSLEHYNLVWRNQVKSCKHVYPTEEGKRVAKLWLDWFETIDRIAHSSINAECVMFWKNKVSMSHVAPGTIMGYGHE